MVRAFPCTLRSMYLGISEEQENTQSRDKHSNVCMTVVIMHRANKDNSIPVRYPPIHKGIYSHQSGQEKEESLQIPLMQCIWVEVTCNSGHNRNLIQKKIIF